MSQSNEQHLARVPGGERLTRGDHWRRSALLCGPAMLWLLQFLLVPLAGILAISFMSRGDYGEIVRPFTLENYQRLLGFGLLGFDALYPLILLRSLVLGASTMLLCLLLGVPLAFFICSLPGRWRRAALLMVVIPFWTNLLIRTYAWQLLLAPDGWLSAAAQAVGLLSPEQGLYPGPVAVLVGMVCDFLPLMVLPVYASVEKMDWSLPEAAADLGADRLQAFRHAVLPQIRPGVIAGSILVFLPATGQFVIPDLLGGAMTMMLGNLIEQQFGTSRDWPFGSAIAVMALTLVLVAVSIYMRKSGGKRPELV